jgi:hypothetical protein
MWKATTYAVMETNIALLRRQIIPCQLSTAGYRPHSQFWYSSWGGGMTLQHIGFEVIVVEIYIITNS